MPALDFDKMDDLELFVRHFRHAISSRGDFPVDVARALIEATDVAWAEVSVRRERRTDTWLDERGLKPARKGGGA